MEICLWCVLMYLQARGFLLCCMSFGLLEEKTVCFHIEILWRTKGKLRFPHVRNQKSRNMYVELAHFTQYIARRQYMLANKKNPTTYVLKT